jgi:hypothetical protein
MSVSLLLSNRLAFSRCPSFHGAIVWMRLQMIVSTGPTEEMDNLFFGFADF